MKASEDGNKFRKAGPLWKESFSQMQIAHTKRH